MIEANDDDDPATWGVEQIDSATGLPLRCLVHDRGWCQCRSKIVAEGKDAGVLWNSLLIRGGDSMTLVDVNITMNTVLMVRLLILNQWPSDRDQAQMQVQLAPKGRVLQTEPFKSDPSLLYLGFLNMDEGRGVLRELVIGRFAGIFAQLAIGIGQCRSKSHGPVERKLYEEAHKSPARAWDWDFETWLSEGYCPTCSKRREEAIEKARQLTEFESRF